MPKRPMTAGTMPMPSESSTISIVKRGDAVMLSNPMEPRKRPKAAINRAFHIGPLARNVRIVRPMIIRAKYSGGPNFKAISASGGAISINPTTPIVPAMKEAKAEIPSAGPALPFRAIW